MEDNSTIIRTAKVIDDADPELLGRVQVRIFPEMADVADDNLPWAKPWNAGSAGVGDETGSHSPPEIDSWVKVKITDSYWTSFYYEPHGSYIKGKYIYEKIEEVEIDEIEAFEYPQPRFFRTQEGTIYFHNTKNGDCGIKHSTGSYAVINSSGDSVIDTGGAKVTVLSGGDIDIDTGGAKVTLLSGGDIDIDTGGVNFHIGADGEITADADKLTITGELQVGDGGDNLVLFTDLNDILTEILGANVIAPTGPSSPLQKPDGTPLISMLGQLMNIKSEVSTSD